jgi:hypothetical protein
MRNTKTEEGSLHLLFLSKSEQVWAKDWQRFETKRFKWNCDFGGLLGQLIPKTKSSRALESVSYKMQIS